MECGRDKVNRILLEVDPSNREPLETYRTMIEENCFGQAKIYDYHGRFLVYMVDEERACVEIVDNIEDARRIAVEFTDSICSGGGDG